MKTQTNIMTLGLLLLLCAQGFVYWTLTSPQAGNTIRTLPILNPVSLQMERSMRNGEPAQNLHRMMDQVLRMDTTNLSKSELEKFQQDRQQMLSLRDQRHALNVKLMHSGVRLLQVLTPEQWEIVQSHRDQIQATYELQAMQQLLDQWTVTE